MNPSEQYFAEIIRTSQAILDRQIIRVFEQIEDEKERTLIVGELIKKKEFLGRPI